MDGWMDGWMFKYYANVHHYFTFYDNYNREHDKMQNTGLTYLYMHNLDLYSLAQKEVACDFSRAFTRARNPSFHYYYSVMRGKEFRRLEE